MGRSGQIVKPCWLAAGGVALAVRRVWVDGTAEPEPPPAHSIGRVGEDTMGRSGQIVKPCWLAAGSVTLVVRNWWRG